MKMSNPRFSYAVLDGNIDDIKPSRLSYFCIAFREELFGKFLCFLQHDRSLQQNYADEHATEWCSIVNDVSYDLDRRWIMGVRVE
jgi:hypothetical protein